MTAKTRLFYRWEALEEEVVFGDSTDCLTLAWLPEETPPITQNTKQGWKLGAQLSR